jgi:putative DNA primase/helicase
LNLRNGTLLINSDGIHLLEHLPEDYLTYQLDFKYEKPRKNRLFLEFLDDILPDKETQRTLQQGFASLFIHELKLEKALFLYGTGGNGKSVFFEIVKGIIPSELITHYSLENLVSDRSYERAELNNKLINYGSDINMKKINHGVFKQLVSGEPVNVRMIYEKPFIMKRYAKMIFNLNKIDDTDVEHTIGFFRRMIFIPFEKTIPEENQDKDLHKKILYDKEGILNWIIEGINDVIDSQSIYVSKRCKDFLDNFSKDSNITARFVEEYSIKHSISQKISFQHLYNKFTSFCRDEGEKPIAKRIFNKELRNLKFLSKRLSDGNFWLVSFS